MQIDDMIKGWEKKRQTAIDGISRLDKGDQFYSGPTGKIVNTTLSWRVGYIKSIGMYDKLIAKYKKS